MENWQWAVDLFTGIGMAVCILVTLIAIVWLTCFFVKLLVKSFGDKVGKSYELMVEDITKKAEAKKVRNEKKRQAKFEQKTELLNMKLESKARLHEMKKFKLSEKLEQTENVTKIKLFGEDAKNMKFEAKKVEEKPAKEIKDVVEEKVKEEKPAKETKPKKEEQPKEEPKVNEPVEEVVETEAEVVETKE